jgi:iron complex transport system substrate-binding protein
MTVTPRTAVIEPSEDLTRRRLLTALPVLGLIAIGVACGDEDSEADGDETATGTSEGFPVTIEHVFGSTTVATRPSRVVTIGFTDHDVLLALGVTPVGLRDWYGDFPHGVWPWAQDRLGDAAPRTLGEELDFEAIAALKPDLILGLYIDLTEEEYGTLSRIAPTVAQSGEYAAYSTPWQEMTRTAGRALGKTDEAEASIRAVEAQIAEVRRTHPEFEGLEFVYAGVTGDGKVYVESSGSTRVAVLTSLGFVVPEEIDALTGDAFYAELSEEQLRLLDNDLVFWELGSAEGMRPTIETNAVYRSLAVAREGRHVFVDDLETAGALAHADVLSIPYFIDKIVPRLAAAIDGDPATSSD